MDILLFRLYGPMASWGDIAVGESRHSAGYPGKSAILGLVAAALGIERDNEDAQQQLQEGYGVAVQVLSAGSFLRDYHTSQAPDSAGKFVYRTRRDELVIGKDRLGTVLSKREYRGDALAVAALRTLVNPPFSLEEIKQRLLKPIFQLYLGRKSCPLAAPLNPQLLASQADFLAGFNAYRHLPLLPQSRYKDDHGKIPEQDKSWLAMTDEHHYYWEGELNDLSGQLEFGRIQTRIRYDQPFSRKRWQFVPRQEHYYFQGVE
jgi:CRISPR system Cascade subunit CasD